MKENKKKRRRTERQSEGASFFNVGEKRESDFCAKRVFFEKSLCIDENDGCIFISISINCSFTPNGDGDRKKAEDEKGTKRNRFFGFRLAFYIVDKLPSVRVLYISDDEIIIEH